MFSFSTHSKNIVTFLLMRRGFAGNMFLSLRKGAPLISITWVEMGGHYLKLEIRKDLTFLNNNRKCPGYTAVNGTKPFARSLV